MLRHGLEAGDLSPEQVKAIESHARTGRPLGSTAFIGALESATGRSLKPRKRGPKPKAAE
jgi:putative transposase